MHSNYGQLNFKNLQNHLEQHYSTQLCRFIWIGCIKTQQKNKKMSFGISVYSEIDFMQVTYVILMIIDYIEINL